MDSCTSHKKDITLSKCYQVPASLSTESRGVTGRASRSQVLAFIINLTWYCHVLFLDSSCFLSFWHALFDPCRFGFHRSLGSSQPCSLWLSAFVSTPTVATWHSFRFVRFSEGLRFGSAWCRVKDAAGLGMRWWDYDLDFVVPDDPQPGTADRVIDSSWITTLTGVL